MQMSETQEKHVEEIKHSKRELTEDDLVLLSGKIGNGWREVGNGLKLNHTVLDRIENETTDLPSRVEMMLFRWMNWKAQKATVQKLTKILIQNEEIDALMTLRP